MFGNLSERLTNTLNKLRGQGRLTEANIESTLREIRIALLEADVALSVVKETIAKIQSEAIGQAVINSITPGQTLIKIVRDELTNMMGEHNDKLNLSTSPPAIVLMAGLQGSGKTTTAAKLARFLKETQHKKVMLVSTDIYRPAAIEQLEKLAQEVEVHFHPSLATQRPIDIALSAIESAKIKFLDVVIVDTAGRLHIDEAMMTEIKELHQAINPIETLFVVDSMTGQDAANTAKVFNDELALTGVILTKADGDARGGAALSIRQITGKPIKFIGVGEKTENLEPFYPDRIASRILGMGDILTLVEEAERKVDVEKAKTMAKKLKKGKSFNFDDFLSQLQEMKKMGGMSKLLDKIPGLGAIPKEVKGKVNDDMFVEFEAIIRSMTDKERRFPNIIKGSRRQRIANGSGTTIQKVNRLLKQFDQMQKMMKRFSKGGGLAKLMGQMKGQLPF